MSDLDDDGSAAADAVDDGGVGMRTTASAAAEADDTAAVTGLFLGTTFFVGVVIGVRCSATANGERVVMRFAV